MLARIKKLALVLALPAALAIGIGATVVDAGQDKVTICHLASHKYVKISVAEPAVPAHMAHGDLMPDEYGDCP